jgi:hypothetical protein
VIGRGEFPEETLHLFLKLFGDIEGRIDGERAFALLRLSLPGFYEGRDASGARALLAFHQEQAVFHPTLETAIDFVGGHPADLSQDGPARRPVDPGKQVALRRGQGLGRSRRSRMAF